MVVKYSKKIEEYMQLFANSLNERDRRRYAAVEAEKLGHGGLQYICELLVIDPKTVREGQEELKKKDLMTTRIRSKGGGAPVIEATYPTIHGVFEQIMEHNKAGNPMKDTQWTHLSLKGIVSAFEQQGIQISTYTVRYLLKLYGYGLRKMVKSEVTGNSADRNAQFEYINNLLKDKKADPNVVILSIDSKKKESLGTLYRQGKVYTKSALAVFDHDYPNLSEGKVVPHGIYDLLTNQCYINLGISHDTAEFARDSLIAWWDNEGSNRYATATEIVLLSDGGGSNRASGYLYKQSIQEFANHTQKNIQICHYPPYCSKYNPIEHRAFPHVTRAISGVVLDTVDTIKQLIEQKATTQQGFTTKVNVIDKLYETGKTVAQQVIDNIQIIVDKTLAKWNYLIKPIPNI